MQLGNDAELAMHVYRLVLRKEEQVVDYATIVEVHHPDYLDSTALTRLYEVDTEVQIDSADLTALSSLILEDR